MSEDLLGTLQLYEEEYPRQPLIAQRADLQVINHIRTQLGMPLVDAHLKEIGTALGEATPKPQPQNVPDHTEARAIYQAYLKKRAELEVHRAYAERVAKATTGPGQTPIRPLATMGTDGGPLQCDHCGKPIVLEGGDFHGVTADAAWKQNPRDDWNSWILGGLVVEIQTNGTLRIYHGYLGQGPKQCCNAARRNEEAAQARFQSRRTPETFHRLLAFLKHDFPDMADRARIDLVNEILNTLYEYDPGIGINRPSGAD